MVAGRRGAGQAAQSALEMSAAGLSTDRVGPSGPALSTLEAGTMLPPER